MRRRDPHPGLTAVEVLVAIAIAGVVGLFLLLSIPRGRVASRRLACQKNLVGIGRALAREADTLGTYPAVTIDLDQSPGPLAILLHDLDVPDFSSIPDSGAPARPPGAPRTWPEERRIRGVTCPTDPAANEAKPAPTSYRANTGATPDGQGGPFALGRTIKRSEVEAADGASFTAAFAERAIGDGRAEHPGLGGYSRAPGAIGEGPCPVPDRGDAGSSWRWANWRSTLYNHALQPGATASCIGRDGATAKMGASSFHPEGVNVLLLDGSIRTVRPSVDPAVWRALGTVGEAKP